MATSDPETLLLDLDPAQREAVTAVRGPLCILAGAGSGKTRVISRRVAYALATGTVQPRDVLVVTFTDKAAGEMRHRLAAAGHPGVAASTFHAAALRQLRHFWPQVHDGPMPAILDGKVRLLAPLAASLPGGYRYLAVRDLAAEIEWAKARRIDPSTYGDGITDTGHEPPLPADLMAGIYRRYEAAKSRAGVIDFEDMLELTVQLITGRPEVAEEVRARYRWFSVDEFQDTNPLQAALLDAWLGDREDLAVVGDEDQTIYTFTGASSDYLVDFTTRHPAAVVVRLESNYRSSPQVIDLANRVLAAGRTLRDERRLGSPVRPAKRLLATQPDGPAPSIAGFDSDEAESAAMVDAIRLLGPRGVDHADMAILVRTNAQLPAIETTLTGAGIPFQVRGERYFARPEIRRAIRVAERLASSATVGSATSVGPIDLGARLAAAFERELGVRHDVVPSGDAVRERHGAVVALLQLAEDLIRADPEADLPAFLAEVGRRTEAEARGASSGVSLLTYHRAKGLEWDAVFLPGLEDGVLPIRQAGGHEERAEERRLLYVGITRARRHLWISWARRRTGATGREGRRTRSPFLDGLVTAPPKATVRGVAAAAGLRPPAVSAEDRSPLSVALRSWRTERARTDKVAPFIVFHDSTLEAIASRRPTSIPELRRVPGVGATKLDRYGDEIIDIVVAAGAGN